MSSIWGAGSKSLYTMWTALGDVSLEMGPLAFCPGSHKIRKLKETYGAAVPQSLDPTG